MKKTKLYPCVRCLGATTKKIVSGIGGTYYTVQCVSCGFNVSSPVSALHARELWQGFKVWEEMKSLQDEFAKTLFRHGDFLKNTRENLIKIKRG
jgi:hypothetical protein